MCDHTEGDVCGSGTRLPLIKTWSASVNMLTPHVWDCFSIFVREEPAIDLLRLHVPLSLLSRFSLLEPSVVPFVPESLARI